MEGKIKIKICGMKDPENVAEVVKLCPDFLGFILYRDSPRFIEAGAAAKLTGLIPSSVIKTGVIVNEPLEEAIRLARSGIFDVLQLHGNADVSYCRSLSRYTRIIKAFRISDKLPADLSEYEPYCNMFLFDSAGTGYGGNGTEFDHRLLGKYNFPTKFILAGGISPDDHLKISNISNKGFAGVDLNSRFEAKPGIKNIKALKQFINSLRKDEEYC